jgi:hypothetical protein
MMGVFGSIRDAIFGGRRQEEPVSAGAAAAQAGVQQAQAAQQATASSAPAVGGGWSAPHPAEPVDVEAVLQRKLADKGNPDLNWRSSIVDLMKLLDLDSSLDNRKALASELGYEGAKDGSAEMNIWLHRKVMAELERFGGKVPPELKG